MTRQKTMLSSVRRSVTPLATFRFDSHSEKRFSSARLAQKPSAALNSRSMAKPESATQMAPCSISTASCRMPPMAASSDFTVRSNTSTLSALAARAASSCFLRKASVASICATRA